MDMKDFDLSAMMQAADPESETILNIDLNLIDPDLNQVRDRDSEGFSQESIEALAQSIEECGLLEPIIVRPNPDHDDRYIIVLGERRYRASCFLRDNRGGASTIKAIVRNYDNIDEAQKHSQQIVENFQRKDLDTLELARSIKRLVDYGYSVTKLAKKIGLERSKVSTYLGISELPQFVQDLYDTKQISHNYKTVYDIQSAYKKDPQKAEEFINKVLTNKETFDGNDLKNLKSFVKGEDEISSGNVNSSSEEPQTLESERSDEKNTANDTEDHEESESSGGEDTQSEQSTFESSDLPESELEIEQEEPSTNENLDHKESSQSEQGSTSVTHESEIELNEESLDEETELNDDLVDTSSNNNDETSSDIVAYTNDNSKIESESVTEEQEESESKPLTGFKVRYNGELCDLLLDLQDPNKAELAYISTQDQGTLIVNLSELEFLSNF